MMVACQERRCGSVWYDPPHERGHCAAVGGWSLLNLRLSADR